MAKFTPVRYSGSSHRPISDGQMLVDSSTGLMSFDIGEDRIQPNNIYGITKQISSNLWIHSDGKYYINVNNLVSSDLPDGFSPVSASIPGTSIVYYSGIDSDGCLRLYTNERITCSVLIMALPGAHNVGSEVGRDLVALYHMEEVDGNPIDCSGVTTISGNGWAHSTEAKYGSGSIVKSSIGSIVLNGLDSIDSFTIEWWQYDAQSKGDGGVILSDSGGNELEMVPISKNSSYYRASEWKHIALCRKDNSTVYVYVNGKLVGFSNFDVPLGGDITFYGTQCDDGSAKVAYIDELAIFNYSRYTENFDPVAEPYVGAREVSLGVSGDIIISSDKTVYDIPVELSNEGNPLFDISQLPETLMASISNTQLSLDPANTAPGEYHIIVRYPGSISKKINVIVPASDGDTEVKTYIYYGYFTSDTADKPSDITDYYLNQQSVMRTSDLNEQILDMKNTAPAGSFLFCAVPADTDIVAYQSDGCREWSLFSGMYSSNGDIAVLNNMEYRIYGTLCLIDQVSDIRLDKGTPELYIDGALYSVDNTESDGDNVVYTAPEAHSELIIESSDEALSGVYKEIIENGEKVWSN